MMVSSTGLASSLRLPCTENPCEALEEFGLLWVPEAPWGGPPCQRPRSRGHCGPNQWLVTTPASPARLVCRDRPCQQQEILVKQMVNFSSISLRYRTIVSTFLYSVQKENIDRHLPRRREAGLV